MGFNDGATKKSLFIQVRSYNASQLANDLEHVRIYHKDPNKDDYIFDVVLDEIGEVDGTLHSNINLILPYLPGGASKAFNNVFVGSRFVPWTGSGSHYNAGMKDSGHRWANLNAQKNLWQSFAAVAPGAFHFYINHEGVLDWLDDSWLRQCYEAYLNQSRVDAESISSGKALLWSPAVWSGVPLSAAEEAQIATMFANLANLNPPGVNWLHFQDMMGRDRSDITLSDVKQWHNELAAAHNFDSLGIDMEYFTKDSNGNLVPEDPATIAAREDWYENNGLPVRSSWELRWWMQNHTEL